MSEDREQGNVSQLSILVLKDIVEELPQLLIERFEYLKIPAEVTCIASKRLYQLLIKSNDVFTVMRGKKTVESMLPDSKVIIESIGGIPYKEASADENSTEKSSGQA